MSLRSCFEKRNCLETVIEEKGLKQITGTEEIEKMIHEMIASNQKTVEQYRGGKKATFGFLVGQVMKATSGQANPGLVNELLKKILDA